MATSTEAVERFLAVADAATRPEIWIHRVPHEALRAEASRVDAAVARGEALPLAGLLMAAKDNIDVAGCPTTAGAPTYAYEPAADSTAIARVRAAGAIVVGKTNLDQFATGLVGTRSPFGAVRHAEDETRISGGSSSGSAVAVALGLVDFALGTDTAGSGRVPAALHGLWGVKPTRGTIPTTGVVPACVSLDCVTVFAGDPRVARAAVSVMSGPDGVDPLASRVTEPVPPSADVLVVPTPDDLAGMAEGWLERFDAVVDAAIASGMEVRRRSIAPLLDAAKMLYESSFVAERFTAVGEHIVAHVDQVGGLLDPTVAGIIRAGEGFTAAQLFADQRTLEAYRVVCRDVMAGAAAILTPTTTWHPTLAQVQADPVGANAAMGRFTNFANLLDMASIAFPAGRVAGLPFGAMLTGPAFSDDRLASVACRIGATLGEVSADVAGSLAFIDDDAVEVFVVGAHRAGQVLNHELADRGAVWVRTVTTAPCYRLYALATTPAKPGLVRAAGPAGVVVGEVWRMSAAAFGAFVDAIGAPMAIGSVELVDGSWMSGFVCEPLAIEGATDISDVGDWVEWLSAGGKPGPK